MIVPVHEDEHESYLHAELWQRIEKVLRAGFTGQVVLHCSDGRVRKWDEQKRHHWPPEPHIVLDRNQVAD